MESTIRVRANAFEMRDAYANSTTLDIRSFEKINENLYRVKICHNLPATLQGTFTLTELSAKIKENV